MLALSHQHNLLKYTVCMVAALSVQEVLIEPSGADKRSKSKWQQMRRFWAGAGNSLLLGKNCRETLDVYYENISFKFQKFFSH